MAERFCDACGRDIPDQEITEKKAGPWKQAMFCPACLTRVKAAGRRRILLAGLVLLAGLGAAVWSLDKRRGNLPPPHTPAASLAGPQIPVVSEEPDPRASLEALRAEMTRRLDELAMHPGQGPSEEVQTLAASIDAIHRTLEEMEMRLARIESNTNAPAGPSAGTPPQEEPRTQADPEVEEIRKRLKDLAPRARLAALTDAAALPSEKGALLASDVASLLSDEYGYVRREAARTAERWRLAVLAPPILKRLANETDILARNELCASLAAITGIPYDPLAHTGEMLDRQIARWKAWAENR